MLDEGLRTAPWETADRAGVGETSVFACLRACVHQKAKNCRGSESSKCMKFIESKGEADWIMGKREEMYGKEREREKGERYSGPT